MLTLEALNIPSAVKTEAASLLRQIETAQGVLELATAGGMTQGFVAGLNCLNALTDEHAQALEDIFSAALDQKMAQART